MRQITRLRRHHPPSYHVSRYPLITPLLPPPPIQAEPGARVALAPLAVLITVPCSAGRGAGRTGDRPDRSPDDDRCLRSRLQLRLAVRLTSNIIRHIG